MSRKRRSRSSRPSRAAEPRRRCRRRHTRHRRAATVRDGAKSSRRRSRSGVPRDYARTHRMTAVREPATLAFMGIDVHERPQWLGPRAASAFVRMREAALDDGVNDRNRVGVSLGRIPARHPARQVRTGTADRGYPARQRSSGLQRASLGTCDRPDDAGIRRARRGIRAFTRVRMAAQEGAPFPLRAFVSTPQSPRHRVRAVALVLARAKSLQRTEAAWRIPSPACGRGQDHQTSQRSAPCRTIGASSLHSNAALNSGRFDSGPLTRNLAIGCGSPCTIVRCVSGRISSPRHWPQARKNCCSGVKPSMRRLRRLALARFLVGAIRDLRAGEIADRFAEHELAVVMDAGLDEIAVELVARRTGRARWNFFRSSGVHQLSSVPCASNCAP